MTITYTEIPQLSAENKKLIGQLAQLSERMQLHCTFKMVKDPIYTSSSGGRITLHGLHLITTKNVYIPNEAKQAIASHDILTRPGFCSIDWFREDGRSYTAAKDETLYSNDFAGQILISCNDWFSLSQELEIALAPSVSEASASIEEEKPAPYSSQPLAVDAKEIPITYTECSKANEENKELIGLLTQLSESMHLNCIFKMVKDPVYIRSNSRSVTLHGIHLISEENVYIPNEAKQAIANHEILTRDGFCSVEWFRMDGTSGAAAKDEKICTDDFIGKILISCNDWPLLRDELELALALKFSALSVSETNDSMAADRPQSSVGIKTDAKHPIFNTNQYESSSSSSSPVSTANAETADTERLSSLGL